MDIDDYLQGKVRVGLPVSGVNGASYIETPWGRLVFGSVAQLVDGSFLALEGDELSVKIKLRSVE